MCAQTTQNFGGFVDSTHKTKKLFCGSNLALLEWENHTTYLTKAMQQQFKNKSYVDCTLSAEQQFIKGHKVILAACSPYFEHLFRKQRNRKTIVLKDVKFEDLKSLFDFMYLGEVVIPTGQLNSLLQTAEALQVNGLTNLFKQENGIECINDSVVNVGNKCKKKKCNCTEKALNSKRNIHRHSCANEDVISEYCHLPVIKEEHENNFTQVPECASSNDSNLNIIDQHNVDTETVINNEIEIDENDISLPDSQEVTNLSDTTSYDELPCTSQDSLNFPSAVNVISSADSCKNLNVKCENNLSRSVLTRQEGLKEDFRPNGDNVIVDLQNVGLKVSPSNCRRQGEEPKRNSSGFSTNLAVSTGKLTEQSSPVIPSIEEPPPDGYKIYSLEIPSPLLESVVPDKETRITETSKRLVGPFHDCSMKSADEARENPNLSSCSSKEFSYIRKLRCHVPSDAKKQMYECKLCLKSFITSGKLKRHLSIHCGEKAFKCIVCSKTFSQSINLKRHLIIHSSEKKYHCTICSKRFSQSRYFKTHLAIHSGEKKYQCIICSKRFTQSKNLKAHLAIHSNEKKYQCSICSKRFSQSGNLKRHLSIHSNEKKYQCSICSKRFSRSSYLKIHLVIHSGEKKYQCTICSKRFSQFCSLKTHLVIHSGEKKYQCTICSKRFSQSGNLKTHLVIHSSEKKYQCTICSKRFSRSSYLKIHLVNHSGEKKYQCTICSKRFSQFSSLKTHRDIHSTEKRYQCTICSKRFSQSSYLKTHLAIHSGENKYQCTICSKRFSQSSYLKKHLGIHSDEKKYQCTLCSKRFSRSDTLKTHLTIHSGENKYQCTICSKRFSQSSYLKTHHAIHSGENKYQCTLCSKRFSRSSYLKKHLGIHNDEKRYQCTICSKRFSQTQGLTHHFAVHTGETQYKCAVCSKSYKMRVSLIKHLRIHS